MNVEIQRYFYYCDFIKNTKDNLIWCASKKKKACKHIVWDFNQQTCFFITYIYTYILLLIFKEQIFIYNVRYFLKKGFFFTKVEVFIHHPSLFNLIS